MRAGAVSGGNVRTPHPGRRALLLADEETSVGSLRCGPARADHSHRGRGAGDAGREPHAPAARDARMQALLARQSMPSEAAGKAAGDPALADRATRRLTEDECDAEIGRAHV